MWTRIPILLLLAGTLSACSTMMLVPEHQETPPPPVKLVIEVSGTPGLGFEGSIGTTLASRSIEGQVPAQFTVETAIAVVANVTKKQEDGELTVRVLRAEQEVARRTTAAPFGNILLVYTPR
jgi:hypothetical protein